MAQLRRLLEKMVRSPQNVLFDDLIRVAEALRDNGIRHREGKRHHVFYREGTQTTWPCRGANTAKRFTFATSWI